MILSLRGVFHDFIPVFAGPNLHTDMNITIILKILFRHECSGCLRSVILNQVHTIKNYQICKGLVLAMQVRSSTVKMHPLNLKAGLRDDTGQ